MTTPLRLFILSGEPSGDRLATDLVRRLKAIRLVELSGVGSGELPAEGLVAIFPAAELAVMGVADVVARLPRLLRRIREIADFIIRTIPDIVVLVDQQVFSRLLAKRLRGLGWKHPILLYVAPTVWARAPERARLIAPLFDEVLAILPFEPAAMRRLGGPPTSYVGHPALAELQLPTMPDGNTIALLPGSRQGELRRHLPMFRIVAEAIGAAHPIALVTLPQLEDRLTEEVSRWSVPVTIVADRERRAELYASTLVAASAAGTATLELALAGVPMVATHVMDLVQSLTYRRLGRPAVALPSIVLGRPVVPEIITGRAEPQRLLTEVRALIGDSARRAVQRGAFAELRALMEVGTKDAPRQDPAQRVLAHLSSD
ncbi:MAG: hypothetical protein JWR75_345 [Devosia sp.]|nr:hypothetical protein [Devosia sp.]